MNGMIDDRTVFVIGPTDGYRGTQRNLLHCCRIFRDLGLEPCVFTGFPKQSAPSVFDTLRNEGFRLVPHSGGASLAEAVDRAIEDAGAVPLFVHVHSPGWHVKSLSQTLRFLRKRGVPVVLTNVFGRNDWFTGDLVTVNAQISLWDLSRWNARRFFPFRGRGRFGIYLPNVVDCDLFSPVPRNETAKFRSECGIPESAFVIGRAGKTDWPLVESGSAKLMRNRPDVHFLSVEDYSGRAGNASVLRLKSEFGTRVHSIPAILNYCVMPSFYSACDLTLATSGIGESFGYVIAESLACGTPVVSVVRPAYDNAQLEVIDDPGFVAASPRDFPAVLENACRRVSEDPGIRRRAREKTAARYSVAVVSEMWNAVARAFREKVRDGVVDEYAAIAELRERFPVTHAPDLGKIINHVRQHSTGKLRLRQMLAIALMRTPASFFLYDRVSLAKHALSDKLGKLRLPVRRTERNRVRHQTEFG